MPDAVRVALVTGASRGIGAATARRLGADGFAVVLAARSTDDLDGVAADITGAGGDALAVRCDAAVIDDLDALLAAAVDRHGRIDVLVNNAGVLPTATRSERVPVDVWRNAFDVNVTAPWYLAGRCKGVMTTAGGGVVVNVSSTAALYPSVGFVAYNATKAAVSMLTRTLALEWAAEGVRVVGIAPGKIDTGMIEPILAFSDRRGIALNPLGRVGHPDEVADLIAYLVSDRGSFITGSIITIDGGEVLASGGAAATAQI